MSETTSPLRRRLTPSVPFTLRVEDSDGSVFESSLRVAFDLNAFALYEDVTGINVLRDLGVVFDAPNVTILTALLWVGLRLYHPEYHGIQGLETLRANITLANVKDVKAACTTAFLAQLPKEQADKLRKQAEEAAAAAKAGVPAPNAQSPASTPAA